jgi:pilus assembly protein CpaF
MDGWLEALFVYFEDPQLDELTVIGTQSLCLSTQGLRTTFTSPFGVERAWREQLQTFCFAHQLPLTPRTPSAGGMLVERGFRWHALLPPLSACGPLFSLRRHRFETLSFEDFAGGEAREQLLEWVQARRPLLLCGPTGSGKTSLLTWLLRRYAWEEKVLLLEDLVEIPILSPHWVKLAVQTHHVSGCVFPFDAALSECLRLHPDRIVVGEIRDPRTFPFLQVIHGGHSGFMATFHAQTKEGVVARLQKSGGDFPSVELGLAFLGRGFPPLIREMVTVML